MKFVPCGVVGGGSSGCRVVLTAAVSLILLLVCRCDVAAAGGGGDENKYDGAAAARYKDPRQPLKARIDDLLRRMTLAEKIGQMSQIDRVNATVDVINKYFMGNN